MADQDTRKAALDALVREARQDAPPELDWDRAEASLLSRAAREAERGPSVHHGRGRGWLLVAAAVALTTGLAVSLGTRTAPERAEQATGPSSLDPGGSPDREAALSVGARIAAGASAHTVTHEGRATWTLEPGGAARIEALGQVIALELERGAIAARVTPTSYPESFVIRVGGTRVAVRGTRFRVQRIDDTVNVEVSEGVVAVGPVGGKAFELHAPAKAMVALDGSRVDGSGGEEKSRAAPSKGREAAAPDASGWAGARVGPAAATVDDVISAVRSCLEDNTVARGDLRVSVHTRLSLHVAAGGALTSAEFAPPLAPAVQRCVDAAVAQMHFGRTTSGFQVERTVELAR